MTDLQIELEEETHEGTIDVSQYALRMGLLFPVHISKDAYRRYCAHAGNPDRDVYVMLDALGDAIDARVADDEPVGADMPFHYRHKAKGFRETDVRLYASLKADSEGKPWILLHSTNLAPLVQEASVE